MDKENVKAKVIKQFGNNANKYVTSESHSKGEDLTLLVDWLKPQDHWIALDIATGGGHVAKALAPHVKQVVASDLTKEMLANTSQHLGSSFQNIFYVIADAENLPFLDQTFDVITCRIAPHHFPNPDRFVKEVARVLKPNGSFLMIDNVVPEESHLAKFMNTFERLRDESHAACLSIEKWRPLFSEANLMEIKSKVRKKTYVFPEWVKRTAVNQHQIDKVTDYILKADEKIHEYFHIIINEQSIDSLQVDEWMVQYMKN
ncbi:class I SAM-dependent methyltransferase [Bacillus sp. FJAT-50079]|uniref:class I SAM-dependent methyltransferase n=1 Tax=Bacillus sp. FJAT-50079 TaxID=2833577 RepID=UPI001BC9AFBF|nr:class I SAM-dependent methyltransferase [Bacillus sp. FJAT-50079]